MDITFCYRLLANAVIIQAAKDYEKALVADHICSTEETQRDLKEVERFFKGELISLFTPIDGVVLMNKIKRQVIEFEYDLKAIDRTRVLPNEFWLE